METFNEGYYAAMAQIIPVFALVMIASQYWKIGAAIRPAAAGLLNISSWGFVVVGELAAINALDDQTNASKTEELAITFALILPLIRIGLPILIEGANQVFEEAPKWVKRWTVPAIIALSYILLGIHTKTEDDSIAAGTFAVILFAMFVVGSFLGAWPRKEDKGEKEDGHREDEDDDDDDD
jgi:hypothetical protein